MVFLQFAHLARKRVQTQELPEFFHIRLQGIEIHGPFGFLPDFLVAVAAEPHTQVVFFAVAFCDVFFGGLTARRSGAEIGPSEFVEPYVPLFMMQVAGHAGEAAEEQGGAHQACFTAQRIEHLYGVLQAEFFDIAFRTQ